LKESSLHDPGVGRQALDFGKLPTRTVTTARTMCAI
jgi:hypothetical protein